MAPTTYAEVLARNVRAARSRADIGQESLAARMRALGHKAWIRQTVGSTERGRRRPAAEEILALSLALETSIAALMAPGDEDKIIDLPSGETLSVAAVQMSAHGITESDVQWEGDVPVFTRRGPHPPSWLAEASYVQAVQNARRRRAWELLPEEQQAEKLAESRAILGDHPEDTALTAEEREERAPVLRIKPLVPPGEDGG